MTADERRVPTPHGEARLVTHRARSPFVTLLLSHGAGGGIEARDLQALADRLPTHGVHVVLLEQPWRLAGRKVATAPPTLDDALVAAARTLRFRTPARGRRPLRRRTVGGAVARPGSGRPAAWRSRSRCTRQAGRRSRGCPSWPAPAYPPCWCRARTTRWAGPRSSRATSSTSTSRWCPAPTTACGWPRAAPVTQAEAVEIVVESTLEWLVREIAGGLSAPGNDRRRGGVPPL